MKERNDKPRSFSNHVVTRYYRPPEIILLEKNYDQKIDMWSMGCIFAELLWSYQAKQASNKNINKKRILFQGNSCYPLSPRKSEP